MQIYYQIFYFYKEERFQHTVVLEAFEFFLPMKIYPSAPWTRSRLSIRLNQKPLGRGNMIWIMTSGRIGFLVSFFEEF
jgi:hypothetical protein